MPLSQQIPTQASPRWWDFVFTGAAWSVRPTGDSAALVVSGGKAKELTVGQHKNPPVGSGAAAVVPFAAAVTEPWRVLVMSDGVWKYVGWDRVVEIASRAPGPAVIAELQELARLPGSGRFQDDFTLVVLEAPAEPGEEKRD